jgi:hypothetical protein
MTLEERKMKYLYSKYRKREGVLEDVYKDGQSTWKI